MSGSLYSAMYTLQLLYTMGVKKLLVWIVQRSRTVYVGGEFSCFAKVKLPSPVFA